MRRQGCVGPPPSTPACLPCSGSSCCREAVRSRCDCHLPQGGGPNNPVPRPRGALRTAAPVVQPAPAAPSYPPAWASSQGDPQRSAAGWQPFSVQLASSYVSGGSGPGGSTGGSSLLSSIFKPLGPRKQRITDSSEIEDTKHVSRGAGGAARRGI